MALSSRRDPRRSPRASTRWPAMRRWRRVWGRPGRRASRASRGSTRSKRSCYNARHRGAWMNWRITLTPVYWLNVRWRPGLALAGGLALLAHLMLLAPLPLAWRGAAALLLLGLPGFLLALV